MESPQNSYVFDSESATEMARLVNQDRMTTQAMGGPLAGIPDPSRLANILDLGCGPGGWVLDAAFALPDAEVEGVDISRIMVDYANARARSQKLVNASFGVMDLNEPLDLPDASFDLVNVRFLFAAFKRERWPTFLSECHRVLRPGGLLRHTEVVDFGHSNSATLNRIGGLVMQAIQQAGYGFSPDGRTFGMDHILPSLLREQGYQQVRLISHAFEYSTGMDAWADQYHNLDLIGRQMKPLLIKFGLITDEDFDQLHQQALGEMYRKDFLGIGYLLSVIGQKPEL